MKTNGGVGEGKWGGEGMMTLPASTIGRGGAEVDQEKLRVVGGRGAYGERVAMSGPFRLRVVLDIAAHHLHVR